MRVDVGLGVDVLEGVSVCEGVAEAVVVGLGVNDGSRQAGTESVWPNGSRVEPN